jgi:hypothetical protein
MGNINIFNIPGRPMGDVLYNFKIINFNDLDIFTDGLKDMSVRNIDGFLVKGVLSTDEANTILGNLDKLDPKYKKENPSGYTYPAPFAIARDEQSVDEYLEGGEYFINQSSDNLAIDIIGRIKKVFEKISGGRQILTPPGNKPNSYFTPSTIRVLIPNFGGIHLHSGNYFQKEFPSFFEFLSHEIDFRDQLSYFIMIQPPKLGGELTIYDIEWRDSETKSSLHENKEITLKDGTILKVDNIKRMYISPEAGDMIMFAGGPIWHRVEDILGENERITVGGFMAFSHDDKKVYFWA